MTTVQNFKMYTWEEFQNLDKDLQKIVRARGLVYTNRNETKRVEDDEKIAYYYTSSKICMNLQGVFYKKSVLEQWISYSKVTKKVKVSRNNGQVRDLFIQDYLKCSKVVLPFINRLTPTLCKRIIEGKIFNLEGILKYHRSYTIRKKDMNLETVGKFTYHGQERLLQVLEDPENLKDFKDLSIIPHEVMFNLPFKFSIEQLPKINEMYEKWYKTQNERLLGLQRSRNEEVGNNFSDDIKI